MDWITLYSGPTFNSGVSPGNITDSGQPTSQVDPRTIHSISMIHHVAVVNTTYPNNPLYQVEYWNVGNLSIAYTSQTDAQAEYDRLLAILQAAADAGDSASAGSTTTTVTIPEITITAESAPSA